MFAKKTILAKCIVKDAHSELGHGCDVLLVLSHILSKFFIPGVRRMSTDMKKSCPGCIKLNKKPFATFEADIPNVLKTVQPPFCYCQADIFGPAQKMDPCNALSVQPSSASGNPPQLQLPEHHQRFQENICTLGHT